MPVNPGKHLLWLVVLVSLLHSPLSVAQDVNVRAQLSASTITRDESVTLTITATGIDAELDASALEQSFDVLGRSSSRQVNTTIDSNNQMVNTSVVTWALELLPRGQGVFTVPAVKVGDYETQLLSLTVNDVPQGAQRDIFVEASVDTTTPWVQSQVIMTLRVFQAIDIVDGGLDIPEAQDLVVERLGDDTRSREVRDGREYSVTERRFALFPQRSGSMTIQPVVLSVTVPADPNRVRGFFSPTRKLTRRTEPLDLNVQARPPGGAAWWLPAANLQLQSQWQGDHENAQVDQPLTYTMVIRAEGVLESQLPTVSIPAVDGLSLYAEEPTTNMLATPNGLVSEQRINWALIPQRSGELTLPAVVVEWFNTSTGEHETAQLPEQTLFVETSQASTGNNAATTTTDINSTDVNGLSADANGLAVPNTTDNTAGNLTDNNGVNQLSPLTSGDNQTGSVLQDKVSSQQLTELAQTADKWRFLSFAALFLWILTMLSWWVFNRSSRQARQAGLSGSSAAAGSAPANSLYHQLVPMSQLETACRTQELPAIKAALLEWTERQWPQSKPATLDTLKARLPESAAQQRISMLQRALYSKAGNFDNVNGSENDWAGLPKELKDALQLLKTPGVNGSANTSAANDGNVSGPRESQLPRL